VLWLSEKSQKALKLTLFLSGQSPSCGFHSGNASFPEPFRDTKIDPLTVYQPHIHAAEFL